MADIHNSTQITVEVDGTVVQEETYPLDAPLVQQVHKTVVLDGHEIRVTAQFDPPLRTTATPRQLERLRGAVESLRDESDPRWHALMDAYNALHVTAPA